MLPPLYAARCSPAPAHTRLTACGAQRALRHEYSFLLISIHTIQCSWQTRNKRKYIQKSKQAAARSGYDYGVVDIKYVVTWTANQSGLVTLTFDLLTSKVVFESRVTWATSTPILVFLGLSVLDLGPMYATDLRRQTDVRRQTKASLNASAH